MGQRDTSHKVDQNTEDGSDHRPSESTEIARVCAQVGNHGRGRQVLTLVPSERLRH